ncbi:partial Acetolactate synthase isozyme 1 large subunit, partial [Anaerolineae bacterium]
MLEKNGAQVLCDCLQREGVEVVFGIPGVHNVYLFEALRRAKIRVVIATHEQAVGFMANGYSRATGKTGVFVTVPGPGFTNAFTSIAESLLDSCAVIGIVTGTRNDLAKEFQLHEIHQVDLARPIVKQVYQVSKASQVAENARTAFRLAQSGEPGPVILEIAANVYWERAPFTQSETKQTLEEPGRDEDANIHQVVALIKQAKHIGLFVGQGALDAAEQITQIAEWLVAPVATTVSGRGCLREDHPLAVDFRWGKHGVELTNQVFAKCDLVIAVGAKFSENGTA